MKRPKTLGRIDMDRRMVAMHLDYGWSPGKIGRMLGVASTTVRKVLVEAGVYKVTHGRGNKNPPITGFYVGMWKEWSER